MTYLFAAAILVFFFPVNKQIMFWVSVCVSASLRVFNVCLNLSLLLFCHKRADMGYVCVLCSSFII